MAEILKERLRREGAQRRIALIAGGCSTYRLSLDHRDEPRGIICLCCGVTSYHSSDIVNLYCPVCASYHTDWLIDIGQDKPTEKAPGE